MSNEFDQANTIADAENQAEFMAEKINQLKGRLEATRSGSFTTARWEGMIEDCQIILNHLETKRKKTGVEMGLRSEFASHNSVTTAREQVSA